MEIIYNNAPVVTGLLFIIFSKRGSAAMGASGIVFMMILLGSFINVEQGSIPVTLNNSRCYVYGQRVFRRRSGNIKYEK